MKSDLIERLKKAQAEIRAEDNKGWGNLLDEVIAALSPVLPDKELESAIVVYDRERTKLQAQVKELEAQQKSTLILLARETAQVKELEAALKEWESGALQRGWREQRAERNK